MLCCGGIFTSNRAIRNNTEIMRVERNLARRLAAKNEARDGIGLRPIQRACLASSLCEHCQRCAMMLYDVADVMHKHRSARQSERFFIRILMMAKLMV